MFILIFMKYWKLIWDVKCVVLVLSKLYWFSLFCLKGKRTKTFTALQSSLYFNLFSVVSNYRYFFVLTSSSKYRGHAVAQFAQSGPRVVTPCKGKLPLAVLVVFQCQVGFLIPTFIYSHHHYVFFQSVAAWYFFSCLLLSRMFAATQCSHYVLWWNKE